MKSMTYLHDKFRINEYSEPIFIFGCHKSGTSLLRALLDSHPQLASHPKENHFFSYAGGWHRYPLMKKFYTRSESDLRDVLNWHAQTISDRNDAYSDSPTFQGYDFDQFKKYFKLEGKSVSDAFFSYFDALRKGGGDADDLADRRVVDKSVENFEHASLIRAIFPKAKFLHIVRHPYSIMSSTNKALSQYHSYLKRVILISMAIANSLETAYFSTAYDENYMSFKYEDLVASNEKQMREIAEFLGIEYSDCLLQPTENGVGWRGNSASGYRFTQIDSSRSNAESSAISPIESWLVNKVAGAAASRWNYRLVDSISKVNLLKLGRNEPFYQYLHNRLFLMQASRNGLLESL
jgi:hypothetical protein